MGTEELKETFAQNARKLKTALFTNSASRFIFKHAGWISFGGYAGGNAALAVKNGLHFLTDTGSINYDGASGVMMFLSTLALPFANHKKYGDLAFRLNGITAMIGIGLLAYSGYNNNGASYHDWWKTLSPLLCWTTTAVLTMTQKEIAQLAEKAKESESKLVRAFGEAASYPVAYGAALDATGIVGLFKSAQNTGDWKMKITCAIWSLGVTAFGANDPRLQKIYREENHIPDNPTQSGDPQPSAP